MFKSLYIVCIVVALKCCIVFADGTFLSQYQVDSMIDNAMFKFYHRFDPSNGITHNDAINYAKGVASELREKADRDVNKKYILAKVSELEQQIYLEENGLTIEKGLWSQKKSNELITWFNSGIAQDRPDFSKLYKIKSELALIDKEKGDVVEKTFRNRTDSLCKVMPSLIDQSLLEGKITNAQQDLAYCIQNASYLTIPVSDLAHLEAKVVSKSTTAHTVKMVKDGFDSIKQYLGKLDFKKAHAFKNAVAVQINILKKELLSSEWTRYNSEIQVLSKKVNAKEDSLITITERLIRNDRIVDAGRMVDSLDKIGVNSEKLATVNSMLLYALITQQTDSKTINIYGFDADSGDTKPVLANLLFEAKSKALSDRENSLRLRSEKSERTQITEIKKERAAMSFDMRKKRAEARKNSDAQKAYEKMVEIFSLVEENKLDDARKSYTNAKKFLLENVTPEDIMKMDSVLGLSKSAGK
ncbi:MAG: hypothetical protein GX639_16780 [Fibrobacter sp.]|nr:hypothetical protein [Fibrobacter sp.]